MEFGENNKKGILLTYNGYSYTKKATKTDETFARYILLIVIGDV